MIGRMIAQRLAIGVLTLILVSAAIFFTVELLPGDFAEELLGQSATPETLDALRRELGLDQPAVLRYIAWLAGILRGDLGASMANGRPIAELFGMRLVNTLALALYAAVLAVPFAIAVGLLAAMWRNSPFDRLSSIGSLLAVSVPEFLVAYLLVFLLAQGGWFPAISSIPVGAGLGERLYLTFLPALSLTLVVAAHMLRMTRAAVVNTLALPYIEMARLKGVPRRLVIWRHALPNALAPIINVVALNMAYLITGVVVVESVFAYPGLGKLLVDSVARRDLPVVQAASLFFALIYIVLNLTADILSTLSNPRVLHRR